MFELGTRYFQVFSTLIGLLLRWLISYHSYSGKNNPPMYGDYEAQRHWMEITFNLPIKEWYFNTSNNDLSYWGLDYPPITAYHSLLCGYIANMFIPQSVKLFTSRGYESYEHQLFMRMTVLIADILIYIPAIVYFLSLSINCSAKSNIKINPSQNKNKDSSKNNSKESTISESNNFINHLLCLLYPGLILIDYGHFQYNCISLGLFIWSVINLSKNNNILTCILFCLSLNYKQMELYHALSFFFYYLGIIYKNNNIKLLFKLIIITLVTFIVTWLPFLDLNQMKQIVHRIFPIYRGIFEDKVANFWCHLNIIYKFKLHFSNDKMALLCLCTTLMSILPSCLHLLMKPNYKTFQLSLINVSLGFFLFSYHVHEKSILLVATPVLLYLPKDTFMCVWFLLISTFSMFDLFIKDNLIIPSIVLTYLYYLTSTQHPSVLKSNGSVFLKLIFRASLLGCVALVGLILFMKPPQQYLYLYNLFISFYSFVHFILFFIYFNLKQFEIDITKINLFSKKVKKY